MRLPRFNRHPPNLKGNNREVALDIMDRFLDWADKESINYNIDFGTLLGAVRENDFIPWDDDLDFCLFDYDIPKILDALPRLCGMNVWISKRNWDLDLQDCTLGRLRSAKIYNRVCLIFKGRIHADLYIKYRLQDQWYWQSHGRACRAPHRFHDRYETMDFLGRTVRLPADTEAYLEHAFGDDWRTPIGPGWIDHARIAENDCLVSKAL